MAARRARLLDVKVQAQFIIDDGETLIPWVGPVVDIGAAQWLEFAGKAFGGADLAAVLEAYEAATGVSESPKPNRTAWRAKPKAT